MPQPPTRASLARRLLVALSALLLGGSTAAAGGPLAVDVVTLKSGRSLRGAVLSRSPDGTLLMAVSREWLERVDPQDFARRSEKNAEEQQAAWTETRERIEGLLADPPDAPRFVFFLKQERQRIEKALQDKAAPPAPFLLIEASESQVAKAVPAPSERQRLALFAWHAGVSGVETRPAAELRRALISAGVNIDGPLPDLSDKLPARRQSEDEWSARLAIVRYTLDEALDFQGTGNAIFRVGDNKPVPLTSVIPLVLSAQVDSLLGEFLEPGLKPPQKKAPDKSALRTAIALAEKHGQRGFRVTRLDLNAEGFSVAVHAEFVARLSDGQWQTVWRHTETADGRQPRPDAEARIADDPQVRSLLESLRGLGVGEDNAVTQAVRAGAATMSAQQACDAKFFEFRDRYTRRLDGPVLPVGSAR